MKNNIFLISLSFLNSLFTLKYLFQSSSYKQFLNDSFLFSCIKLSITLSIFHTKVCSTKKSFQSSLIQIFFIFLVLLFLKKCIASISEDFQLLFSQTKIFNQLQSSQFGIEKSISKSLKHLKFFNLIFFININYIK
ncbi:hypothetical protein HOF65_07845 [bacterium]|nr:hypothetical protein [bacterium]MBT3853805.1 hypothetical protein [bacterium]MBT4632780.1 hypothetical protein [bacterium]MBT6779373.1 hypothetical protein [bacterium]